MDRAQIKANGKFAMQQNYGMSILTAVVLGLAAGTGTSFTFSFPTQLFQNTEDADPEKLLAAFLIIVPIVLFFSLGVTLISTAIRAFLLNPLNLGCRTFFLRNLESPASPNYIGAGFKGPYIRNVLTMFLTELFTFLWTLLFIIPGIVMGYAYRLVPYIIADDPDIQAMDAIKKSKEMMKGHKMEAFIFDLSFFGWFLLNIITFGIAGLLFVNPYYYSASAEFYRAIRDGGVNAYMNAQAQVNAANYYQQTYTGPYDPQQ